MALKKDKSIWQMLKRYGRRSIFFKNCAILFCIFFIMFSVAIFFMQYFIYNTYDNHTVQNIAKEMYASRNRLESIINLSENISRSLEKNQAVNHYISDADDMILSNDNTEAVKLLLKDKIRTLEYFDSIYLWSPQRNYVISSSEIYKSSEVNLFRDISWLAVFNRQKDLFYREYPFDGIMLRCMTYCDTISAENGKSAIVIYNINYSKSGISRDSFAGNDFYLVDNSSEIIYSSDENAIGAASDTIDNLTGYISDANFINRRNTFNKILLTTKTRKHDIKLILKLDKTWMTAHQSLTLFIIECIAVIALISLLMAAIISSRIYKPITRLTEVVRFGEHREETEEDEINDIIEYISNLDNQKKFAENKLIENVMLLKHTQMVALQTQINPHFLFNTLQLLNSIILAEFKRDTEAAHIVKILSELLRAALDTTSFFRTLSDEVKFTKEYLKIQSIRYPDIFDVEWDIAEDTLDLKVPKCVLQPLLENAISYGMIMLEEKGRIWIKSRTDNGMLIISVRDNGPGFEKSRLNEIRSMLSNNKMRYKNNIGLCNVNQRIKVLFGDHYGINIVSGEYTTITITLPVDSES